MIALSRKILKEQKMSGILYYDCFAGISGDMHLSAMIDLGVGQDYLISELKKLNLSGYEIKVVQDQRRGISGTKVTVLLKNEPRPLSVMQHHHEREHRNYAEILKLINVSSLSENVKTISKRIFDKVAVAEAKIHNVPVEKVHFHEVGAVDSIVDIVGAAICLDFLKPSKVICSVIELGSGMAKCDHGIFPVPAPATVEILKGIPVKAGNVPFEATTPTGAAILAAVVDEFVTVLNYKVEKTAYGIGHKDSPIPNVLRVMWCAGKESNLPSELFNEIVCNIDDMSPELYDYIFEKLFNAGADDVYLTNIHMKKNRPAQQLSVLCKTDKTDSLIKIILQETSTLGVRVFSGTKIFLNRESFEIETSLGKVKVKKSFSDDMVKIKPEYDDCSRIARERNMPLPEVVNIIKSEIDKMGK